LASFLHSRGRDKKTKGSLNWLLSPATTKASSLELKNYKEASLETLSTHLINLISFDKCLFYESIREIRTSITFPYLGAILKNKQDLRCVPNIVRSDLAPRYFTAEEWFDKAQL
jgi:hypothetical protein